MPFTPKPGQRANSTAAETWEMCAGSPDREAGSASMHASTLGVARVAAGIPTSRAGRSARLAASSVEKPNARSMPRAGLQEGVAGAVCLRSTAAHGAPPAPCTNPGARTARTPPAAGATPNGTRKGSVQIAVNPRGGPPVASPAQSVRISARITFAGCSLPPRATPSSHSPPAKTTGATTAKPRSRCVSLSRSSGVTKSR